jgi:hypothetical protein
LSKEESDFKEGERRALYFCERICVPNDEALKKQILDEAYRSRYTIQPEKVKAEKKTEKGILVARTKERRGTICIHVYNLSKGKG